MCGIIGIVGSPGSNVATSVYDGLIVLQHRGQDAAGIVTSDYENICHRRANGLVRDVFLERHMKSCLLYTSPSPRDRQKSRMPSSA